MIDVKAEHVGCSLESRTLEPREVIVLLWQISLSFVLQDATES